MLSRHARKEGAVRPSDHSHDLLLAIGAGRTKSTLVTANGRDMKRWAPALERSGLRVRVEVVAS